MVLRVAGRRRGHGMVQRDGHTLGDQHTRLAELLPDATDGGRVVVAEHDVGPRVDDLADFDDVEAGSAGQGFLGECLWSGRLLVIYAMSQSVKTMIFVGPTCRRSEIRVLWGELVPARVGDRRVASTYRHSWTQVSDTPFAKRRPTYAPCHTQVAYRNVNRCAAGHDRHPLSPSRKLAASWKVGAQLLNVH